MDRPFFSIIVPFYNAGKFLPRLLENVTRQGFQSLELLCVDDGSTDFGPGLVLAAAARDDRIRLLSQSNQGPGAARNLGMKAATGQYLLFLDADDFLEEDSLTGLAGELRENPDILFGRAMLFGAGRGLKYSTAPLPPGLSAGAPPEILAALFDTGGWWSVWGHAFRREFLRQQELFFPVGIYAEDLQWFPAVVLKARSFAVGGNPFYRHRVSKNESLSYTPKMERDLADVILRLLEDLPKHDLPPEIRRRLASRLAEIFSIHLWQLPKLNRQSRRERLDFYRRHRDIFALASSRRGRLIHAMIRLLGVGLTARLLHFRRKLAAES